VAKQSSKSSKRAKVFDRLQLIVTAACAVALIFYFLPEKRALRDTNEHQVVKTQTVSEEILDPVKAFEAFLAQEEAFYKNNDANEIGLDKIRKTLATFYSVAERLHEAKIYSSILEKEDIAYLASIEKRLSTLQQQLFPKLRKAFAKRTAELLWENDIYIKASGSRNTKLQFTGYIYSMNRQIKQNWESVSEPATKLRFKQVGFRAFEGGKGYYYTLEPPSDASVQMFKFGAFKPISKGDK
jgi:hypothetical protein